MLCLDGCPTFASAYVGRERRAKPLERFYVIDQQVLAEVKKNNRNISFSAHLC